MISAFVRHSAPFVAVSQLSPAVPPAAVAAMGAADGGRHTGFGAVQVFQRLQQPPGTARPPYGGGRRC